MNLLNMYSGVSHNGHSEKWTNLVARIKFAKHAILKLSPRSGQLRTTDRELARTACLNVKLSPKNGQPETAPNDSYGYHKIYI